MGSMRVVGAIVFGLITACTPLERHLRGDASLDAADARGDVIDESPSDAGATDVIATDVVATDVIATDVIATDIAADVRPTCPMGMVMISAGQFLMGDPAGISPAATPVHGVRLTAYCMDLTEVTVAAYRGCTAAGCTAPDTAAGCNWGVAGRDDHPINCITGEQAGAYCRWRGGDLPTEAQWEFAARGTDNRTYPWGSAAPGARPCWSGGGTARAGTCAVATFPDDVSPTGLLDMAGNVMEWTSDGFATYTGDASTYVTNPHGPVPNAMGTLRMMRGSHWRVTDPTQLESVARIGGEARAYSVVGVRCARSLE